MTTPTVPQTPILGHVDNVELIHTGLWPASTGPFDATAAKIASAVEAMDCPAIRRPVLKLGHDDSNGEPAVGWVDNLRTGNEGTTLIGDFRGMPGWLTETDDNGVSILAAAYPDRSIEGEGGVRCTLGHIHPFVVTAVSLLGVERPAIGTLESLQDLYGVAAAADYTSTEHVSLTTTQGGNMPQPVQAAATTDDVRRAFYEGPGQDWALWIGEMYIDPPELIVRNDEDGTISRMSYSVDGAGVVTFGDPETVKIQYVAARAGGGDRTHVAASRSEAREGMPSPRSPEADPAPGVAPPTGEEPAVAFSDEQITNLRKLAGVADDADEATILAALDQAVGEASPDPEPQSITPPPAAVPLPVAASSGRIPSGAVVIDSETLERLQEQGRQGAEAAARLAADDRDRAIDDAIKAGKFAPSRREHWKLSWQHDPEGTKQALASMPANMVPVSLTGSMGDPDEYAEGEFDHLFSGTVGGRRG